MENGMDYIGHSVVVPKGVSMEELIMAYEQDHGKVMQEGKEIIAVPLYEAKPPRSIRVIDKTWEKWEKFLTGKK